MGDLDGSLRRLLHREPRQQQPRQADRRRRPLGRRRGPQVRLLGHRLVVLLAPGDRPRREQPDRHRRRQGRQGLLVGDRQPDQPHLDGLRQDVRPDGPGRQQDHGRLDPDPRRPRQLRGRRPRHGAAARLRPRGSDQAQRLRLLLAARHHGDNWPTTGNVQVVGYNQISRFTLNAAGTEVVAGLRAPDPARSRRPRSTARPPASPAARPTPAPATSAAPAWTSTPTATSTSASATTSSPNARGHSGYPPMDHRAAERWDARKTSANSADLRGKVVRIKPLQGTIPSDATPGVDSTYTIPAGNMFAPGTPKTRPEIYAMGFRQPFTLHTDPKNPGIVGVGEYCHDNSRQRRQPRSGRHLRVEPDRRAGLLRLAVLRRQQLDREHDVPLELRDERVDRPAVRLLARARCRRTSATPRPARRRSSRPTTVSTPCPARPSPRRSGRSTPARPAARAPPTSVTSAPAACSRWPVRSTATTRPPPARARSRATTTAPG